MNRQSSEHLRFQLRHEELDFLDRAPVIVERDIVIPATPDEVWLPVSRAEAWQQWFRGVKVARYSSPEPIGVGSTRVVKVYGLRVNEELLAFDPGERLAYRVLESNLPGFGAIVEQVALEPVGEASTRVVFRQAVEPTGAMRLLRPVLRPQLGLALSMALRGLARHLTDAPAT